MALTPAEKQRAYRDRQRAAKEAERMTGNADRGPAPTTMQDAFAKSLEAAKWITDSDQATVEQAKMLARRVDELTHEGDDIRALSAHGRLTTVLDRLGMTPTMRLQRELRSRKLTSSPEVPDDSSDGESAKPGNVSRFERPAKRRAQG